MFRRLPLLVTAFTFVGLTLSSVAASAGPIITFATSVGTQPGNVGIITLTQEDANSVNVKVDLIDSTYGFINTGGPHTPFAFQLTGSEVGVTASFLQPLNGSYGAGFQFSLNLAGGDNNPFGTYGVAIETNANNGSNPANGAYYGDLEFLLTRPTGLNITDFIANADGYFFSADLTNGRNTGAQGWSTPVNMTAVPEPASMMLLGSGLVAAAAARRRKKATQVETK